MLTVADMKTTASSLISQLTTDLQPESGRLGRVARYLAGGHDHPYAPRGARVEYRQIAQKSITNWLPVVSDTFTKALWVVGYRGSSGVENSAPWDYWQANGLDARQSIVHRGALEYGVSYVLVLPGVPAPLIRPLDARRTIALYEDDDSEYPVFGLIRRGKSRDGSILYDLLDNTTVYHLSDTGRNGVLAQTAAPEDHGMGVVPMVRFRERLDGEATGIIAPLIGVQDRINETVFSLHIALQYASFRQRWATGLAIPVDEDEFLPDGTANPSFGTPVEPFEAAVDRLWTSENESAKFGDFAQTEVSGHLNAYDSTVRTLVALAQLPPTVMPNQLVNLSAEALSALESATQRKLGEYEMLFGEAWETTLRLAAVAAGDRSSAADTASQVRWSDTEARSLSATVDALGKLVQMLKVPPQALWERVPGVTQADVEAWRTAYTAPDGLDQLIEALGRQTTGPAPVLPGQ